MILERITVEPKYSDTSLSLALLISGGLWGLYWIPIRELSLAGLDSYWSIFFINACPLLVLSPMALFKINQFKFTDWSTLLSGLTIGLAFTLYAGAILETTVVRATLLFYLSPIWGTIFGTIFLSERFTVRRTIAIIFALFGLFLLLSNKDTSNFTLKIGDFFGFLSGLLFAIGSGLLKRSPRIKIFPLTFFVYAFTSAGALALVFFFIGQTEIPKKTVIDFFPYVFLWSTIIFMPSFMVVFKVSQTLFPGRVAILLMSEIIVAVVTASILLPEERMTLIQWLGALAIVIAGFIEILFSKSTKYISKPM